MTIWLGDPRCHGETGQWINLETAVGQGELSAKAELVVVC